MQSLDRGDRVFLGLVGGLCDLLTQARLDLGVGVVERVDRRDRDLDRVGVAACRSRPGDHSRHFYVHRNCAAVRERDKRLWRRPLAIHGELRDLTASSLLLWGHDDIAVPGERGLLLFDGMPRAEFHMLHHCGHWPQHEHAAEYNERSLAFLAACAESGATGEYRRAGVRPGETVVR